jgi:maltokinase
MSEHPQMTAYLGEARWFAGKGLEYDVIDVVRVGTLPGPPAVTIDILTVQYAGAEGEEPVTERYQMPLSHYAEEQHRIGHAHIGPHTDDELGFVHSYDAVHDREAMAVYLRAFAQTPGDSSMPYGGLVFHRLSGHELDLESHSTLFSGEQSNSSVAFGDDSLLKVFRKVTPGATPTSRSTAP